MVRKKEIKSIQIGEEVKIIFFEDDNQLGRKADRIYKKS